ALKDLSQRERAKADELLRTVHEGIAGLGERLTAGSNPDLLARALERLHQDVTQAYPSATRWFRLDPWREVEAACLKFEGELRTAIADRDQRHLERVLDLAWRAFCAGGD